MGNCSNLCSRIIMPNSDVPVSVPTFKQNNNKDIDKYSKEPYISKIIYIQSRGGIIFIITYNLLSIHQSTTVFNLFIHSGSTV